MRAGKGQGRGEAVREGKESERNEEGEAEEASPPQDPNSPHPRGLGNPYPTPTPHPQGSRAFGDGRKGGGLRTEDQGLGNIVGGGVLSCRGQLYLAEERAVWGAGLKTGTLE